MLTLPALALERRTATQRGDQRRLDPPQGRRARRAARLRVDGEEVGSRALRRARRRHAGRLDGLQPRQRRPGAGLGRGGLRRVVHRAALADRAGAGRRAGRRADGRTTARASAVDVSVDGRPAGELGAGRGASARASCARRPTWRRCRARRSTAGCARSSAAWRRRARASRASTVRTARGERAPVRPAAAGTPRAVLLELRVENLLLIERAELRLAPGPQRAHGRDRGGQDRARPRARPAARAAARAPGIVRPGAAEAYVEGVFDLPAACAASSASGCRPTPRSSCSRGACRPRGARGRTQRALGVGRRPARGRRRAARLLRPARAPQADAGLARSSSCSTASAAPEQPRSARGLRGGARAGARARGGAGGAARARGRARARARPARVRAAPRSRRPSPSEAEEAELRGARATGCATSRRCARRRWARREAVGADERRRAATGLLAAARRGARRASRASTRRSTRWPSAARALAIEADDLAGELRRYGEGLEAEPGRARGGRGAPGGARPPEAQARRHDRGGARARASAAARGATSSRGAEVALEEAQARARRRRAPSATLAARAAHGARATAAPRLAAAVRERLAELAMEGATFEIALERRASPGPTGADAVEFLHRRRTPACPPAPLREIASGGELSRVMLALLGVANDGAGRDARLRRGRRRHRRPHRPRGRRAAARARRGPPGRLHHPPAADRLAGRAPLLDRQGHVGASRRARRSASSPTDEVVGELVRMLGADADDVAARRHAKELLAAA